jgi:16S rRNA (guanine(966)-N(2))-methyltransferase RsmD
VPHEVRIIGGQWKRTRLPVPDLPGLRPTPDRVRETLFNWLGQDLAGWRCLDAFAGSGALGFEAASRGALEVVMLESDARQVASLRASQRRLEGQGGRIERGDALAWMARRAAEPAEPFDLVLLDPPFERPLGEPALQRAVPLLSSHGVIYVEAPARLPAQQLQALGLIEHRHLQAGASHAHLLRRAPASPGDGQGIRAARA